MPPCTWVPCIAYGIFTASSDSTKRWRKPLRNKGISRLSLAGRRVAALSTNGDQKFAGHESGSPPLRVRNLNADPSASQQKMRAWHRWRWLADAEPEIFRFIEGYYNQTRLRSHNGYRSPNEAEADLCNGALAA